MDDKVIVTHRGALTAKYGRKGVDAITAALRALAAADKKRGIKDRIVYLDNVAAMNKLGAKPLLSVANCREAKAAIDGVFKALKPDYLMILGAPDVVPHQDLTNPTFGAGADGDDDPTAWGDLPYACDTAYGRDPAQFVGPTRVVGRLPDLTGAREPSHLLALLKTAAAWRRRPAADYESYFGLSATEWQASSRLSLDNIFGNNGKLILAPPKGPKHRKAALQARMHFINCHGGSAAPAFQGQLGDDYPISLTTRTTTGAIQEGTVASVECCFGGQLFNSVLLGSDVPIPQSYLAQGAYGYLGSTTIAYGPAEGNGAADLICQDFLLAVLDGASIGRAALMARQQFVERCAQMDPVDLKTLAQFCLYGDPSIHPVAVSGATTVPKSMPVETAARFRRGERRAKFKQTGDFLQSTKPTASKRQAGAKVTAQAKSALANIAAEGGLPPGQAFDAFRVKGVKAPKGGAAAKLASAPSRYYVTVGRPKPKADGHRYRVAVVAKESGGHIIDYRIYYER